ncbi:hypothetical protein RJ641_023125 [Dillenia turbinata]|uniref:Uncharacterized protein n=1 Tax=Dillenia turbinata TaxID=194707 RepID=A0AAN8UGD3_9MAGN
MFKEEVRWKDMEYGSSQALVIEKGAELRIKIKIPERTGHIKRNCRLFKEKRDEKGKSTSDDSNVVVVGPDKEIESLICTPSDCNYVGDPLSEWIVDIEAAYHCVLKRKLFTTYKKRNFGIAKRENNIKSRIIGIGDIVV